jgi:hypothetical protein
LIKNEYTLCDDYVILHIVKRSGIKFEVKIDKETLDLLDQTNYKVNVTWNRKIQGYYGQIAKRFTGENGKRKGTTIMLHRFVMGLEKSKLQVDHRNHDTLDNRKKNLRVAEQAKNVSNRKGANKNNGTGMRNVNWGWNRECYIVQFMKDYQRYAWEFPLDQFDEACKFADQKRIEIFGEFAGNH